MVVRLYLVLWLLILIPLTAGSAWGAFQPDLAVRGAADSDAAYLGSGVIEAAASLQSVSQGAFEGSPARYRVQVTNAGDFPDRFLLKGTGGGSGFAVAYLDDAGGDRTMEYAGEGYLTALLPPGTSVSFLVQVTPAAITPGASFRVAVTAVSVSDGARLDQVKTETVACGSTPAVTVSAPPDGTGLPGSVVVYAYTVTNVGSAVNEFGLSTVAPGGWSALVRGEDGAPKVSTGPLAPGLSSRFVVAVTVPAESLDGANAATRLVVAGTGAGGSDDVTTTALAAAVTVTETVRNITQGGSFQTSAAAYPGDTLEYRMSVTNSGSAPANALSIDQPLPQHTVPVAGTFWVGTSGTGGGSPCAGAECGTAKENAGRVIARLGQGATESTGGALSPGKTLYVYYRVQVE
ncbi:hypothetical protein GMSM_28950 [Geomonas sp. Red276]